MSTFQSKEKDANFIKKLFDASENHNKNLSELITILKKNVEEEKTKVNKLTQENSELKQELNAKSLSLTQTEQQLIDSRANESRQAAFIKSLEEQLQKAQYRDKYSSHPVEDYPRSSSGCNNNHNNYIASPNMRSDNQILHIDRASPILSSSSSTIPQNTMAIKLSNSKHLPSGSASKEGMENLNSISPIKVERGHFVSSKPKTLPFNSNSNSNSNSHTEQPQAFSISQTSNLTQSNNLTSQRQKENNPSSSTSHSAAATNSRIGSHSYFPFEKENNNYNFGHINKESVNNPRINPESTATSLLFHRSPQPHQSQQQQQPVSPLIGVGVAPNNDSASFSQTALPMKKDQVFAKTFHQALSQTKPFLSPASTSVSSSQNTVANTGAPSSMNSFHSYQVKSGVNAPQQPQAYQHQRQNANEQEEQHSRSQSSTSTTSTKKRSDSSTAAAASTTTSKQQQLQQQSFNFNNNNGSSQLGPQFNSFQQKRESFSTIQKLSKQNDSSNSISPLSSQYRLKAPKIGSTLNSNNNSLTEKIKSSAASLYFSKKQQQPIAPASVLGQPSTATQCSQSNPSYSNNSIDSHANKQKNNSYFTSNSIKLQNDYDELANKAIEAIGSANSINIRDEQDPKKHSLKEPHLEGNILKAQVVDQKGNSKRDSEHTSSGIFHRKRYSECGSSGTGYNQYQNPSEEKQSDLRIVFKHQEHGKEGQNLKPESVGGGIKYVDTNYGGIFQRYSNFTSYGQKGRRGNNTHQDPPTAGTAIVAINPYQLTVSTTQKQELKAEDVLDNIANVEEDIDEAANLENLNGSHFKLNIKGSQKNIRINTEQYFSKIESPPLSDIKSNVTPAALAGAPPHFMSRGGGEQNLNQVQVILDQRYFGEKKPMTSAVVTPTQSTLPHGVPGSQYTNRLQTDETSKYQYETTHQSVETYNRINNKMIDFKCQINTPDNLNSRGVSPVSSDQQQSQYYTIQQNQQQPFLSGLERKFKSKCSLHEQKEPGKIKQKLESSSNGSSSSSSSEIGSRLFEALMIYGPDKTQLSQVPFSPGSNQVRSVKPQLYFKYPQSSEIEKGREDVFQQFAFPFGVEAKQINLTNSLSQLNEVIFSNNMAEANHNCFVFAIKSEQSYQPTKSTFVSPNVAAGSSSSLPSHNSDHSELLEICNPSNLLYGICFRVKEVVQNGATRSCLVTNKLFCFLTYYPFHRFFLDIISSMLNQMKVKRIEYFSRIQENVRHDPSVLSKLEGDFFKNFLNLECIQLLEELKNIALPRLSSTLELNFNCERFVYDVPDRELAKHIEAEWGCSLALQSFGKEMFVNIFMSLLLEQSTVFVSSNSALLSSTMLLFHSLLKPFRWHHPLIFNLPNEYMHLMDIPVPILLGLNKDKSYVYENKLYSRHENCMFVILDDESPVELINIDLPSRLKQSSIYQSLLNNLSEFFDDLDAVSQENSPYKIDTSVNQLLSSQMDNSSKTSNTHKQETQKRSNSTYYQQHGRSKSSIISAASDAFNSFLGNSKFSKYTDNKGNNAATSVVPPSSISISTHKRRRTIVAYPNQKEKKACQSIIQACSSFLQSSIIDAMPKQQLFQQQQNNLLDFEAIQAVMETRIGQNDPFLTQLLKTQLFTVFAEERYDPQWV